MKEVIQVPWDFLRISLFLLLSEIVPILEDEEQVYISFIRMRDNHPPPSMALTAYDISFPQSTPRNNIHLNPCCNQSEGLHQPSTNRSPVSNQ